MNARYGYVMLLLAAGIAACRGNVERVQRREKRRL